jgi:hypothetical protein
MQMPKCRSVRLKLVHHQHFFRGISLASTFLDQGQSSTADHGLVRHCPAMAKFQSDVSNRVKNQSNFLQVMHTTDAGMLMPDMVDYG